MDQVSTKYQVYFEEVHKNNNTIKTSVLWDTCPLAKAGSDCSLFINKLPIDEGKVYQLRVRAANGQGTNELEGLLGRDQTRLIRGSDTFQTGFRPVSDQ